MIHLTLPDSSSWNLDKLDTREVYDHIADFLNPEYANGNTEALTEDQHLIAADAEGWCELAYIGEHYEDSRLPGLSITVDES